MQVNCLHDAMVPVGDLKPHPKNRNAHPADQIKRLASILKYQGWRYPVKVSKRSGFITSGHGRLEAAILAEQESVPVNYQEYESDAQEMADLTSDNAIAEWADLDLEGIKVDVADLGHDFDFDLLGIRDMGSGDVLKVDKEIDVKLDEEFNLMIIFANETQQQKLYEELKGRDFECKII